VRRSRVPGGALLVRSSSLRSYAWRREPRATKSRGTASRGAQHHAGRPGANSGHTAPKASGGLEPGIGCAIAGREAGRRAAHLLSKEGVLDRERFRRVTPAGSKRSRRVSPGRKSAHRENAQRRHQVRFATGASEARSRGHVGQGTQSPGRGKNIPPRRSRDSPKRSVRREAHGSPVSVGGIPLSARPGKTR